MDKQKNSKLGISALILSIIGVTFPIAVILAIIDLLKKDGRKKTFSVISLVLCIFAFTAVISSNISQSKKYNTASKSDNQSQIESEFESNQEIENNIQEDVEEDVFYKNTAEEYISTLIGDYDLNFSIKNYRQWDDGAGFIMVENTFKDDKDIEHKYRMRIGKDNVVYKLYLDEEVVFQADADTLIDYMDKYSE